MQGCCFSFLKVALNGISIELNSSNNENQTRHSIRAVMILAQLALVGITGGCSTFRKCSSCGSLSAHHNRNNPFELCHSSRNLRCVSESLYWCIHLSKPSWHWWFFISFQCLLLLAATVTQVGKLKTTAQMIIKRENSSMCIPTTNPCIRGQRPCPLQMSPRIS